MLTMASDHLEDTMVCPELQRRLAVDILMELLEAPGHTRTQSSGEQLLMLPFVIDQHSQGGIGG